ncbi:MAG: CoA transferase, partial [Chloroflexi bacterium]
MPPPPLQGIRVLEVGNYMAGPFCGMQLADLGADVVKVEDPRGGDLSRRLEPLVDGESGNFIRLNRGKRSVALDLKQDAGAEIFQRLAERADVVVESFAPGTLDRLGCGWAFVQAVRPSLPLVSISNFGQDGPYRDYKGSELVLYGFGGEMYSMGLT